MTIETTAITPAPVAPIAAPIAPPVVAPPDGTVADLTAKLAEANARAGTFAQQVATLTAERDGYRSSAEKLQPRAKRADELEVQVQGFINHGRETALVDALRAKLPGAEPTVIRGVLTNLHEQKKVDRFAEDTAAELAKVLPLITTEAPSLTRPPTAGGGSAGAPQTVAKPAAMSLFR